MTLAREIFIFLYLVILSVCDMKEKKIPLYLVWAGLAAAFCWRIYGLCVSDNGFQWWLLASLLSVLPGGLLLSIGWCTKQIGTGDGLVLICIGLLTDYRTALITFGFGILLMALFSIGVMLLRRANRKSVYPFLPFLLTAYMGHFSL